MAIAPELKPEDVQHGRADCAAYYNSYSLSGLVKPIRPDDAMKLFWPPIQENLTQMVTPLPADRQAWLHGWKVEYAAMLQDIIREKGQEEQELIFNDAPD